MPCESCGALEAFLQEHGSLLQQMIASLCPRGLGIQFDDIAQDARLRLWRALHRDEPIRNAPSYLYRIAATTTIDAIRKIKSRREEPFDTQGFDTPANWSAPDTISEQLDLRQRLEAAFKGLSPNRRRALELHLEGFTAAEIGFATGWSEPKARNLAYRALGELRKRFHAANLAPGRNRPSLSRGNAALA